MPSQSIINEEDDNNRINNNENKQDNDNNNDDNIIDEIRCIEFYGIKVTIFKKNCEPEEITGDLRLYLLSGDVLDICVCSNQESAMDIFSYLLSIYFPAELLFNKYFINYLMYNGSRDQEYGFLNGLYTVEFNVRTLKFQCCHCNEDYLKCVCDIPVNEILSFQNSGRCVLCNELLFSMTALQFLGYDARFCSCSTISSDYDLFNNIEYQPEDDT